MNKAWAKVRECAAQDPNRALYVDCKLLLRVGAALDRYHKLIAAAEKWCEAAPGTFEEVAALEVFTYTLDECLKDIPEQC